MSFHETQTRSPSIADRIRPPEHLQLPEAIRTVAGTLEWRDLRTEDVQGLLNLINEIEIEEDAPRRTTLVDLREQFASWEKTPGFNTLGAFDDGGALRAFGVVETSEGDVTIVRAHLRGGVSPSLHGQGVGTVALAWLVDRAKQLIVEADKDVPSRIVVYLDHPRPGAGPLATAASARNEQLLTDHGFAPLRFFSILRRDLADPLPEVELPAPLRIVPWSEEIDEGIRLAHNAAFGDHWGSQPRTRDAWSQGRSSFVPEWSFAVLDTEEGAVVADDDVEPGGGGRAAPVVAGYLMSSRHQASWEVVGYSSAFTELLGVRREYRGRKVAKALLLTAMRAYRASDVQFAALDVDSKNPSGADAFYERLGYMPAGGERMFSLEF